MTRYQNRWPSHVNLSIQHHHSKMSTSSSSTTANATTTTKHRRWTHSKQFWFKGGGGNNSYDCSTIIPQDNNPTINTTTALRRRRRRGGGEGDNTTRHHSIVGHFFKSLWTTVLLLGLLHTVLVLLVIPWTTSLLSGGNQFYYNYYVFYLPYSPQTRHLRHDETKVMPTEEKNERVKNFPRVVSLEYYSLEAESLTIMTSSSSTSSSPAANKPTSFSLGPLDRLQNKSTWNTDNDDDDDDNDPTRYYSVKDSSDLPGMERRKFPHHEFDHHCLPMSAWQSQSFPVCNELHAADMPSSLFHAEMSLLSSQGSWRLAWRKDEQTNFNNSTIVWKTFRFEKPMEEAFFEFNRVDALAMERLTASPHVVNLYGFCGLSVMTEYAGKSLDAVVGKMNSMERLRLARQVAQGLADIHSLDERPSLVHNDINLANLVFTQDDRPVLNDFNVASLLMKHNETGETCPFVNRFPNAQWKSPEEQVLEHVKEERPVVTEKIDIYALGNIFYRLAVGGSPWKKPGSLRMTPEEKEQVARAKRFNGTLPEVPEFIQNSSDPAVVALLDIMRKCYRFQPKERPTAQSVVAFLTKALDQIEQQQDQYSNTTIVGSSSSSSNNTTHGNIAMKSISI